MITSGDNGLVYTEKYQREDQLGYCRHYVLRCCDDSDHGDRQPSVVKEIFSLCLGRPIKC